MTQSNTPLWRELNEARTQGEWKVNEGEAWKVKEWAAVASIEYGGGDTNITLLANADTNSLLMMEAKANAAYTALAVNNLASLAEALEKALKQLETYTESNAWEPEDQDALDAGEAALASIS